MTTPEGMIITGQEMRFRKINSWSRYIFYFCLPLSEHERKEGDHRGIAANFMQYGFKTVPKLECILIRYNHCQYLLAVCVS